MSTTIGQLEELVERFGHLRRYDTVVVTWEETDFARCKAILKAECVYHETMVVRPCETEDDLRSLVWACFGLCGLGAHA